MDRPQKRGPRIWSCSPCAISCFNPVYLTGRPLCPKCRGRVGYIYYGLIPKKPRKKLSTPPISRFSDSLKAGTPVLHATLGIGIIKTEWGSWFSCPNCFIELENRDETYCENCRTTIIAGREFTGRGIYDIYFGSLIHSAHSSRFKVIKKLKGVTDNGLQEKRQRRREKVNVS